MLPAIMGATAVLSKHVGFWGASAHDAGVRNPPVVVVGVLLEALFYSGVVTSSDESWLQRLVWCFFLHFLQRNLDGH